MPSMGHPSTYLGPGLWLQGAPGEGGEVLWQPIGEGAAGAVSIEGAGLLPTGTRAPRGPAPSQERVGRRGLQLQCVQEPLLGQGLGQGLGGLCIPAKLQAAAEAAGAIVPAGLGGRQATQGPHAGLLNEAEGDDGAVTFRGRCHQWAAAAWGGEHRAGPAPPWGAGGCQPPRAQAAPIAKGSCLHRLAGQGASAAVEAKRAVAGVRGQALAQEMEAASIEVGGEATRGAVPPGLGAPPCQPGPPVHPVGERWGRGSAALLGVEADGSPRLGHPTGGGHRGIRSGAWQGGMGMARRVPSTPEMTAGLRGDASSGSPETRARRAG